MNAYVDTSVFGAHYCPEPLNAAAKQALQRVKAPLISSLMEVESFSLVAKKHRQKELTEPKARNLIGSLNTTLHTLDALHLAVAVSEKLPLLTADVTLAAATRRFRVKSTLGLISKFVRPERSAEGTKSKGSKCLNFQCFDFAELRSTRTVWNFEISSS